jgi:hypothetical protein
VRSRPEARIGGDRIARGQQHDVARHQLARGQHPFAPVAQHPHPQRRQPAQAAIEAFGAALLETADQRIDQHHRDHTRVAPCPMAAANAAAANSQRASELAQEHPQH